MYLYFVFLVIKVDAEISFCDILLYTTKIFHVLKFKLKANSEIFQSTVVLFWFQLVVSLIFWLTVFTR